MNVGVNKKINYEVLIMAISYNKLWKLLIDKNMNKSSLCKVTGISNGTVAKMTNGETVTLTVMEKICKVLQCDIGDVLEFKFDES